MSGTSGTELVQFMNESFFGVSSSQLIDSVHKSELILQLNLMTVINSSMVGKIISEYYLNVIPITSMVLFVIFSA